jgi:hypothetical protein
MEVKPVSSGYADVNAIKLYHEIYGEGEPLALIAWVLSGWSATLPESLFLKALTEGCS